MLRGLVVVGTLVALAQGSGDGTLMRLVVENRLPQDAAPLRDLDVVRSDSFCWGEAGFRPEPPPTIGGPGPTVGGRRAWYLEPEETRYECQQYSALLLGVNLKEANGKHSKHLGDIKIEGRTRTEDGGKASWAYTCEQLEAQGASYRLACERQEDGSFLVTAAAAAAEGRAADSILV